MIGGWLSYTFLGSEPQSQNLLLIDIKSLVVSICSTTRYMHRTSIYISTCVVFFGKSYIIYLFDHLQFCNVLRYWFSYIYAQLLGPALFCGSWGDKSLKLCFIVAIFASLANLYLSHTCTLHTCLSSYKRSMHCASSLPISSRVLFLGL